jgi:hypothetical protein
MHTVLTQGQLQLIRAIITINGSADIQHFSVSNFSVSSPIFLFSPIPAL